MGREEIEGVRVSDRNPHSDDVGRAYEPHQHPLPDERGVSAPTFHADPGLRYRHHGSGIGKANSSSSVYHIL